MSNGPVTLANLEALGPLRAAALWLERMQFDDPDESDTLFQQWLGASEANRRAWKHAIDMWDSFDVAEGGSDLAAMREQALQLRPRRFGSPWLPYAIAASLALVATSTLFYERSRFSGSASAPQSADAASPDPHRFGSADYATGIGERATVTLSDGSRVTLDTDSAIDVAFVDGLRLVRLLRGQAFFDVVHEPAHPFRVAAGGRILSVLGTRFNVRLRERGARVLLVQGAVAVSEGDDPAHIAASREHIAAGEQLIAEAGHADRIARADVGRDLEWRQGFVQFDVETLDDAVTELNRYTRTQLVIRDREVGQMRISGAFRTGDTQGFARTLAELYPLQVRQTEDGKLEIMRRK